jgi:hypothetical protein
LTNNQPVAVYYRALINDVALKNWMRGYFRSYFGNNGAWCRTWDETKSVDPNNYDRGVFTARALEVFLIFKRSGRSKMTDDEIRDSSELAGVCAFTNPEEAFDYGGRASHPHPTRFVNFEGICKGPVPEDNGVVVEVVAPFGPIMTPQQFQALYHLPDERPSRR